MGLGSAHRQTIQVISQMDKTTSPGIYVRVKNYLEWIKKTAASGACRKKKKMKDKKEAHGHDYGFEKKKKEKTMWPDPGMIKALMKNRLE